MGASDQAPRPEVRLATFNAENLLARFDFGDRRRNEDRVLRLFDIGDEAEFRDAERARMIASTDDMRQHSALAIADAGADIVCLQEVENQGTLDAFEHGYLYKMIGRGYRQKVWRMGNDKRGIDVALMARRETADGHAIEIEDVTSHKRLSYGEAGLFERAIERRIDHPNERVFRRDLLEVQLKVGSVPLTLYVTHFKAMGGSREDDEGGRIAGRDWSMPVRVAEARAMRAIIEERGAPNWAVCGDLNDYSSRIVVSGPRGREAFEPVDDPSPAIDVLMGDGFAVNPVDRLDPLDRWTLYHTAGPEERHLCQLDYLLLSPALAAANPGRRPDIVRAGQPYRVPFPPGTDTTRYPRVGWDRPKASDHCPVAMTVALPR